MKGLKPKCSITPDGLPPILFKKLASVLCVPISMIFTRSLAESEVPDEFRQTIVTPIFKKGNRKLVNNYRPVAQGTVMCLLMEKLVIEYLEQFLRGTNQLDSHQHGFCKGRSTETQLLEVIQDWGEARARRRQIHCIYFDFSKAFDKVDHIRLLSKLRVLGIRSSVVGWCEAYLRSRNFVVKVDNSFSTSSPCPSGVPQGSALGPLLWTLYVLDIKDKIPVGVTYKLYADDLKIYVDVSDSQDDKCILLQKAADCVSDWAAENGMEISTPKCAVLKTGATGVDYRLNGLLIPEVSAMRDLGVLVSSDLKFRQHIAQVASSSAVICNLSLRSFAIKRPEYYEHLYNNLISPKLTYCSVIWTPSTVTDMTLLEKMRNRFVRMVAERCNVPRESIKIPTVQDLHRQCDERALKRIMKSPDTIVKFFNVNVNNRRSGLHLKTKCIPPVNTVNNLYSWRVVRQMHSF